MDERAAQEAADAARPDPGPAQEPSPEQETARRDAERLEEAALPPFDSAEHDTEFDLLKVTWAHGVTLYMDLTRDDAFEPIDEHGRAVTVQQAGGDAADRMIVRKVEHEGDSGQSPGSRSRARGQHPGEVQDRPAAPVRRIPHHERHAATQIPREASTLA